MREHGNEVRNMQELVGFMNCNVHVVKAVRIGQIVEISKPRLLKVELQSSTDRDFLLQMPKYFKVYPKTSDIFITPWLQPNKLAELKRTQERCRAFNNQAPAMKNGKKPYVVISGKLMLMKKYIFLRLVRDIGKCSDGMDNLLANKQ